MTPEREAELQRQFEREDAAYEWAEQHTPRLPPPEEEPEDEIAFWRRAALDHRGQP